MQCSLKRRRSQKCHFYSFLRCTCNMQLMTLLGFRRNISYFKAPVRCIGRLLFPGRHTNMFLVDDCKNIERLLRSVVLPHRSKESRTLWPKVFRQMFALIQNFARAGLQSSVLSLWWWTRIHLIQFEFRRHPFRSFYSVKQTYGYKVQYSLASLYSKAL